MDQATPLLSGVVAIADNGVIGKDGGLPWRMRDDLQWFKSLTSGHPVIMGRTTYEGLKAPLPRRLNIVLTRRALLPRSGMVIAGTTDDALRAARAVAYADQLAEAFVIGGATIYRELLPYMKRFYVTHIHANVEGDTKLSLPTDGWAPTVLRKIEAGPRNEFAATITKWDRTTNDVSVP